MNVIVNTTRIRVPTENRQELFQTIFPLLEPIRSEHGCRAFGCYVDIVDANSAVLISEWETEEALNAHLGSPDCAVLFGAISILAGPSGVDFNLLSYVDQRETGQRARQLIRGKE
jgi:quinol monooxygenase YgiN